MKQLLTPPAASAVLGPHGHRWVASMVTVPVPSWTVTCSGHAQFEGDTYEQAEDAWREHVYAATGIAPPPMGDSSVDRWVPLTVSPHPGDVDYSHAWDGVWKVTTETSAHLLDFGRFTVTRLPGHGGGPVPGLPQPSTSVLRQDEKAIPMFVAPDPVIGEPLELFLSIRADGTATYRRTTTVLSVELVEAGRYSTAPEHTTVTGRPYTGTETRA